MARQVTASGLIAAEFSLNRGVVHAHDAWQSRLGYGLPRTAPQSDIDAYG